MITLILPGYSPKNKEWALEAKATMSLSHEVKVLEWEHWGGERNFSLKSELARIGATVDDVPFNILAKSIGTRVAMHLIPLYKDRIKKLYFVGFQLREITKNPIPFIHKAFQR